MCSHQPKQPKRDPSLSLPLNLIELFRAAGGEDANPNSSLIGWKRKGKLQGLLGVDGGYMGMIREYIGVIQG